MRDFKPKIENAAINRNAQPFFGGAKVYPKLTVNAPNDAHEQQADVMADRVMRMEEEEEMMQAMPLDGTLQRKCAACEEEEESLQTKPLLRKAESGGGFETSPELAGQLAQSKGGGTLLPEATQGRMSRAFGADFSGVRVHAGGQAAAMSQGIQAKAFTHGSDIYFNEGRYRPETSSGGQLLAHELTHVVQQGGGRQPAIQRLQMTPSCSGREPVIQGAEREGQRMTRETIETLDSMRQVMSYEGGPAQFMPLQTQFLLNTFGDVGGLEGGGGYTRINTLITNYERILSGFGNRNARCDVETIPNNDCGWRSAFVVEGNRNDIFLCPNFFNEDRGEGESNAEIAPQQRGQTLIHELAHSVLGASHEGLPDNTFPAIFYDCGQSLELELDAAVKNAFAYGILANCLHGTRPRGMEVTASDSNFTPGRERAGNYGGWGAGIGAVLGAIGGGIGGYFAGKALAGSIGLGGAVGAGIGIGLAGAGLGALVGWGIGSLFKRNKKR